MDFFPSRYKIQRQTDQVFSYCFAGECSNWLFTNLVGKELSILSFILLLFLDAEEVQASSFVKKSL